MRSAFTVGREGRESDSAAMVEGDCVSSYLGSCPTHRRTWSLLVIVLEIEAQLFSSF